MMKNEFRSPGWWSHHLSTCVLMGVVLILPNARAEDPLRVDFDNVTIWSVDEPQSSPVRQALDRTVKLEFLGNPLGECLEELGASCGITIAIDDKALDEAGIGRNTPVDATLKNVSLRQALKVLCRPLDLMWFTDHNGIVVSTPDTDDPRSIQLRVYVLNNTVVWLDERGVDWESLVYLIQSSIAPSSWEALGGDGTIFEYGRTLVVNQSEEVHWRIERLLLSLNRAEPFGRPARCITFGTPPPTAVDALHNMESMSGDRDAGAPKTQTVAKEHLPGLQLRQLFPGARVHFGSPSRHKPTQRSNLGAPRPSQGGGMFNVPAAAAAP